jgi:hypothetical protein
VIFTGRIQDNPDGTTTFYNPDGSVMAHGEVTQIQPQKGEDYMDAVFRQVYGKTAEEMDEAFDAWEATQPTPTEPADEVDAWLQQGRQYRW